MNMKGTAVTLIVLSGLCFLPACFPRLYILVEKQKNWIEAQSYCRGMYTDLVSVHNEQDLAKLAKLSETSLTVWIGLHADSVTWRWSLENQSYYGEGEAGFRMWSDGEPNASQGYKKYCVSVLTTGKWADDECTVTHKFICYNGTVDSSSSFIFVNEFMIWNKAQNYCREHYTDLASVRNQAENDQIKEMSQNQRIWIGLYRESWKWSDGSALSFSNWAPSAPSTTLTDTCAISDVGKWVNQNCNSLREFVCYSANNMRKQVMWVVLKKTDSPVDTEELKEAILQKFNQRLKDHNLSEGIKLIWVKQPDGKIFYKKEKEDEEEKTCGAK